MTTGVTSRLSHSTSRIINDATGVDFIIARTGEKKSFAIFENEVFVDGDIYKRFWIDLT